MDPESIAAQFVTQYYQLFDTNRAGLAALYTDQSVLTFEGAQFVGAAKIQEKLTGLPFKQVQHVITTRDCQMTVDGGLIVFVVGQLRADSDPAHSFSQVFHLKQVGSSLFILNDVFRLSLHHM